MISVFLILFEYKAEVFVFFVGFIKALGVRTSDLFDNSHAWINDCGMDLFPDYAVEDSYLVSIFSFLLGLVVFTVFLPIFLHPVF
jgi:hypothetical protein